MTVVGLPKRDKYNWNAYLASPLGVPLKDDGLRVVNRTAFYRCRD